MTPPILPPGWICNRKIGFLFPRVCGKTNPAGCTDCRNGEVDNDPYDTADRGIYLDFDDFGSWQWGGVSANSPGPMDAMDFNESDAESLTDGGGDEADFENDAGGS